MSKAWIATAGVLLSWMLGSAAWADAVPVYDNCHQALDLYRGSGLSPARKHAFEEECVRRQQDAYDAIKDVWPMLRDKDRQACARIVQTQNYLLLRNCVSDQYAQERAAAKPGTAHFQP